MSFRFTADEVRRLIAAGPELSELDADLELTEHSGLRDLAVARRLLGDLAAAAVETAGLRRRAVVKLGSAARGWLFTEEALQQATPWPDVCAASAAA